MKNKISLFLCCMLSIVFLNAGIFENTLVETAEGLKEIRFVHVGDLVVCLDDNFFPSVQPVETVCRHVYDSYIEIITEDNDVLCVTVIQKLFIPHRWVSAEQLSVDDVILKKDLTFVRIKSIRCIQQPIAVHFITVKKHHNFFVLKNGILMHNGPCFAYAGYWLTKIVCYGIIAAGVGAVAFVTGGTVATSATAITSGAVSPMSATGVIGVTGIIGGATLAEVSGVSVVGGIVAGSAGLLGGEATGIMATTMVTSISAVKTVAEATAACETVVAVAGTIESVSLGIFGLLWSLPTP